MTWRAPAGQSRVGDLLVGDLLVVRVAGLPVSALAGLRLEESLARVRQLIALDAWLRDEGADLSGALFGVIGGLADTRARPALVGLRRALHGLRMPNGREWNGELAAVLPAPVTGRVDRWRGELTRRQQERGELEHVLAAEQARTLARLRQRLAEPNLRRGLSQAGPTLLDELDKWLADARHPPQPKKVFRLAKFLSRAATKTSPYSTFTIGGPGAWADGEHPAVSFDAGSVREPRGVLELAGPYLYAVRARLARRPELAAGVRVRVNPTAAVHPDTVEQDTVEFVGHPPDESMIRMGLTSGLRAALRLAGDPEPGGCTVAELRRRLAEAAGTGTAGAGRYLDRLLDAGVLEASVPVADHAADPVGGLGRWLDGIPGGLGAGLARLVWRVHAELRREVPVGDVDGHRRRQAALHDAMVALAEHLDIDRAAAGGRPGVAYHENAVAVSPVATCSLPRWRPALEDLDAVRRFLAVFEPHLAFHLTLGTWCRERFGPGARVGFVALHRAVQEARADRARTGRSAAGADLVALLEAYGQPWSATPAGLRLDRLHELRRLRAEAVEAALPPGDADGIIRVDPSALAKQAAGWPAWVRIPASIGCYVQPRLAGDDLELVLNTTHVGHGRGSGRWRYLLREAGGTPPDRGGRQAGPADQVLAELGGAWGYTLNVRAPSAPSEIDYPFTVSDRPDAERIPVRDLVAVHDPETDRMELTSSRRPGRVVPLHLGMLASSLLPPAARFLIEGFSSEYPLHPASVLAPPSPADPDAPAWRPRVQAGRVVLRRARWLVPAAQVPARAAGDSDAGQLLWLHAWLGEHGIPSRCFVRALRNDGGAKRAKSRKPLYIDFADWFLVRVFEQEVRGAVTVQLEEALPAPEEALGPDPGDPSVTEFLVEVSGATARDRAG